MTAVVPISWLAQPIDMGMDHSSPAPDEAGGGNARNDMPTKPFRVESDLKEPGYTDLFASISEEEDGYAVQVRLYNQTSPGNAAWGEEVAESVEMASLLVEALAAEFSIPQARIKIELRMNNMTGGTRH